MANTEHKDTVRRLVEDVGVTEMQAKIILGMICSEREKSYIMGQTNGYNTGYDAGKKFEQRDFEC